MKNCHCGRALAPVEENLARAYSVGVHAADGCLNDGTNYLGYWDAASKKPMPIALYIGEHEYEATERLGVFQRVVKPKVADTSSVKATALSW